MTAVLKWAIYKALYLPPTVVASKIPDVRFRLPELCKCSPDLCLQAVLPYAAAFAFLDVSPRIIPR